MTEQEFEALQRRKGVKVLAWGWDSSNGSVISVLGDSKGNPLAMRFATQDTLHEFVYVDLSKVNSGE